MASADTERQNVDRIQPEDEATRQYTGRQRVKQAKRHFESAGAYTLVEVEVPERLVGTRLADSKLREKLMLDVVAIRARGAEQARKANEETEEERSTDPAGLCGVLFRWTFRWVGFAEESGLADQG